MTVLHGLLVVKSAAVDEDNGFIYWSESTVLKQGTLNGTYLKDVLAEGKFNIL